MDLAAGLGFQVCIATLSLLVCFSLADIVVDCVNLRSEALVFRWLGLDRLWTYLVALMS